MFPLTPFVEPTASCEQCGLNYSQVLSQELTGTCSFCITNTLPPPPRQSCFLLTAKVTAHWNLVDQMRGKPEELQWRLLSSCFGQDCGFVFVFCLFAGSGWLFFIDNDNGQSKWFSHSNLPKNHGRDFLLYLKYDFCYWYPETGTKLYFVFWLSTTCNTSSRSCVTEPVTVEMGSNWKCFESMFESKYLWCSWQYTCLPLIQTCVPDFQWVWFFFLNKHAPDKVIRHTY